MVRMDFDNVPLPCSSQKCFIISVIFFFGYNRLACYSEKKTYLTVILPQQNYQWLFEKLNDKKHTCELV